MLQLTAVTTIAVASCCHSCQPRAAATAAESDQSIKTHEFEHVPVEDVVVGEALAVEEVAEELSQVRVVGLVVEAQRATEVQVRGELGCEAK